MKDVIVIGTNYSATLGVIRSLGVAGYGIRLIAVRYNVALIAGKSKYVKQCYLCSLEYEQIYSAMEKARGNADKIVVMPLFDVGCMMLDEHADELSTHYYIPNIKHHAGELVRFMNKLEQKQLAKSCGLNIAKGKVYSTEYEGINKALIETTYPCFIKAVMSAKAEHSKDLIALCSNQLELKKGMLRAKENGCQYMMVEEYLTVDREISAYGMAVGNKVYLPAYIETLNGGYGIGTGVAARGKVRYKERFSKTNAKIEKLILKMGLTGLFCVDMILSGNELYFLEVNLRSGASGYAMTLAGANMPGAFVDYLNNIEIDPPKIKEELVFVSEKVLSDSHFYGYISYFDLYKLIRNTGAFFIKDKMDKKPYIMWLKMNSRRYLVKLVKKIIKRK